MFTDDQGWADLGIHGVDPDVRTPNLDQLARDGALFTKGYVTAPQCIPSRAGIMTGRHQNAFGMDDNHKGPLPLSETTMADRLQAVGYATGMIGKWHLEPARNRLFPDGEDVPDEKYDPGNRGFEEYWNGPMVNYQANFDLQGNLLPDAPQTINDPRFRIVVQTEAALAFLKRREQDDRPFFLYLAYFAPHAPMQASAPHMQRMSHVEERERRMGLSSILAMDDGIGEIRQKLEEMGVADNTLIFYISDNGAPLRDRAYVGSFNTPMVGEKGMQTDGGQRVPFIATWPGTIPADQKFTWPVWALDATATSLAVAGAPLDDKIEDVNLMPYLLDQKQRPVHDYLPWRWRSQSSILTGDGKWKFVRLGDRDRYLFDMTEVGHETANHNKIQEFPEVAKELEERLAAIADTWQIKGLPADINQQDQNFFDLHVTTDRQPAGAGPIFSTELAQPARGENPPTDDPLQGWAVRNASQNTIPAADGGGLAFTPERKNAPPLLARRFQPGLPPPVKVEIEARSSSPNKAHLSWISGAVGRDNFTQTPSAEFAVRGNGKWQSLSAEIQADAPVSMLRLFLGADGQSPVQLRNIRITPAGGKPQEFSFSGAAAASPAQNDDAVDD